MCFFFLQNNNKQTNEQTHNLALVIVLLLLTIQTNHTMYPSNIYIQARLLEDPDTEGCIHPSLLENAQEGAEEGVLGGFTIGNTHHRGRSSRDSVAPHAVPRPNIQHAEPAILHRFTKMYMFNKHRVQRISRGSRFDTLFYRMRIQPKNVGVDNDESNGQNGEG
jgi:hypothetical protein